MYIYGDFDLVSLINCNYVLELELQQLFIEAIHNGTMEGFYRLISYFQTQSEPAYCGLASLSMVLNALGIDPGRKWKGNFYKLQLLHCRNWVYYMGCFMSCYDFAFVLQAHVRYPRPSS